MNTVGHLGIAQRKNEPSSTTNYGGSESEIINVMICMVKTACIAASTGSLDRHADAAEVGMLWHRGRGFRGGGFETVTAGAASSQDR